MDTISAAGMGNRLASPWACSLQFHNRPCEAIRSKLIKRGSPGLCSKITLAGEKFLAVFDHEALKRQHLLLR